MIHRPAGATGQSSGSASVISSAVGQHGGAAASPPARRGRPTTGTPRAPCPPATSPRPHREPSPSASKSIPGAHFTDEVAAAVGVEQPVQGGCVVAAGRTVAVRRVRRRRVGDDDRVAGHRVQRVGPSTAPTSGTLRRGHRQPHRVDIAADDGARPNSASAASSAPIEHVTSCTVRPGESPSPMCGRPASAVACCSASSVNNHDSGRRTWPPPCGAAVWSPPDARCRSPKRVRAEAMSATSVASVSRYSATSRSAASPPCCADTATSSR